MGLLYLDYLNYAEILAKSNIDEMTNHLIKLQEMYTILPEHVRDLQPDSVSSLYELNGITNFNEFLYSPERSERIHIIMRQNSDIASQVSNVVKQDIINVYQGNHIEKTNEFLLQGVRLATPFIGGCLGLIVIFTIENLVEGIQGIFL